MRFETLLNLGLSKSPSLHIGEGCEADVPTPPSPSSSLLKHTWTTGRWIHSGAVGEDHIVQCDNNCYLKVTLLPCQCRFASHPLPTSSKLQLVRISSQSNDLFNCMCTWNLRVARIVACWSAYPISSHLLKITWSSTMELVDAVCGGGIMFSTPIVINNSANSNQASAVNNTSSGRDVVYVKRIGPQTWALCWSISMVTCLFTCFPCGIFAFLCPCDEVPVYVRDGKVYDNNSGACVGNAANMNIQNGPTDGKK